VEPVWRAGVDGLQLSRAAQARSELDHQAEHK